MITIPAQPEPVEGHALTLHPAPESQPSRLRVAFDRLSDICSFLFLRPPRIAEQMDMQPIGEIHAVLLA